MSPTDSKVLDVLCQATTGLGSEDVAMWVGCHAAVARRSLKKLWDQGFVERGVSKFHGSARVYQATEEGRHEAQAVRVRAT